MFPLPFGDARYVSIAAEDQGRVIAANQHSGDWKYGSQGRVDSEPASNVKASTYRPQTAAEVQIRHWP
jgi:hypothetical protein